MPLRLWASATACTLFRATDINPCALKTMRVTGGGIRRSAATCRTDGEVARTPTSRPIEMTNAIRAEMAAALQRRSGPTALTLEPTHTDSDGPGAPANCTA